MQENLQQVFFRGVFLSLHQDVAHSLDVLATIITPGPSFVSTCVVVVRFSSSTKPNSGVAFTTVVYFVSNDTDSCFSQVFTEILRVALGIKSSLVTANL